MKAQYKACFRLTGYELKLLAMADAGMGNRSIAKALGSNYRCIARKLSAFREKRQALRAIEADKRSSGKRTDVGRAHGEKTGIWPEERAS